MNRITIYPYIAYEKGERANPYIHDFVEAIENSGWAVVGNRPSRNPLLSILFPKNWGDITVFNWFESIPDYKHGLLQSMVAILYVALLKIFRKKVVWVLHNKKSHQSDHARLKKWMGKYIAYMSNLIVAHAEEGLEIVRKQYPHALKKTHFLHHPTKNRLSDKVVEKQYDFIIWGTITHYKGVKEFLEYLSQNVEWNPSCYIVGNCPNPALKKTIQSLAEKNHVIYRAEGLPFDEIGEMVGQSRFVLVPYHSDTILSSGILMDSLSFGAKVIGPNVGSFKDYAKNPQLRVYTFDTFDDLASILKEHGDELIPIEGYEQFLNDNDWPHFIQNFHSQLFSKV